MNTKPLLYGLIGFFIGGLLVSIAATTFNKPSSNKTDNNMAQMTASLENKLGDDYDKEFIASMIEHHQSAVDMAKLSESRAKHSEIRELSKDIIAAQQKEITQMQKWQADWGYGKGSSPVHGGTH